MKVVLIGNKALQDCIPFSGPSASVPAFTLPMAPGTLSYTLVVLRYSYVVSCFYSCHYFPFLCKQFSIRKLGAPGNFPCFNNLMCLPLISPPIESISVCYNVSIIGSRVTLVEANTGPTTD